MEGKNVILAIALSSLVLIVWAVLFEPPLPEPAANQSNVEKVQKENNLSSPSIETTEEKKTISRSETLKS